MNNNEKDYTIAKIGDEEEVQRICIALAQNRDAFLYRYRKLLDMGDYLWTLSSVLSLRDFAVSELAGTRVTDKELKSLSEEVYDKKALERAAWEVKEDIILWMRDRDLLTIDDEKHQAHATDLAYQIGEQLIKKWNL